MAHYAKVVDGTVVKVIAAEAEYCRSIFHAAGRACYFYGSFARFEVYHNSARESESGKEICISGGT